MSQLDGVFQHLAQVLLPYSDLIGKSGAWLGVFQIISPALVLNRIRKNPDGNKIPIFPFLFVAIYLVLSIRYGQILNNEALYESNLKGFSFSAVYLAIYYYLSPPQKKKENLFYISSGCALVIFIYYYSVNGNPETIARKYESILTSVLWSFHFVAMIGVYAGYKQKMSSHMGFEMILGSTLMGVNRICYGILTDRKFIVIQYILFLGVYLGQLSCFLFFGSSQSVKKEKENKGEKSAEKKKKKPKKD